MKKMKRITDLKIKLIDLNQVIYIGMPKYDYQKNHFDKLSLTTIYKKPQYWLKDKFSIFPYEYKLSWDRYRFGFKIKFIIKTFELWFNSNIIKSKNNNLLLKIIKYVT